MQRHWCVRTVKKTIESLKDKRKKRTEADLADDMQREEIEPVLQFPRHAHRPTGRT